MDNIRTEMECNPSDKIVYRLYNSVVKMYFNEIGTIRPYMVRKAAIKIAEEWDFTKDQMDLLESKLFEFSLDGKLEFESRASKLFDEFVEEVKNDKK